MNLSTNVLKIPGAEEQDIPYAPINVKPKGVWGILREI